MSLDVSLELRREVSVVIPMGLGAGSDHKPKPSALPTSAGCGHHRHVWPLQERTRPRQAGSLGVGFSP